MINYRGLTIPHVDFGGGITSDNLFDEKEQALFDFYEASKDRYRKALDIGANIGVHSMLMARQGWEVRAFEPDVVHYARMACNLVNNDPDSHWYVRSPHPMAVSDHDGEETFVRVKGNTTGSHLKGDKQPYGETEEFTVNVVDCRPLFAWADFCKMDCEGHEAKLLLTLTPESRCEFMVEVGNHANANAIYKHIKTLPQYRMFAQRTGWQEVKDVTAMPTHHSHGALFIGAKPPFK